MNILKTSIVAVAVMLATTLTTFAQGFYSASLLGDGITNVLVISGPQGSGTGLTDGSTVTVRSNLYAGLNANTTLVIQSATNKFGANANFIKGGIAYSNQSAFVDVPLWANRDGSVPSYNFSAHIAGVNSSFTNTFTFYFATIPRGNKQPATQAQNLFNFQFSGSGTNDICISSNLPTAWLQGAGALRLLEVRPTNGGTNGALISAALNGFKPTP